MRRMAGRLCLTLTLAVAGLSLAAGAAPGRPDQAPTLCDPSMGSISVSARPARFGHANRVRGRARDAAGAPLAGAPLSIDTYEAENRHVATTTAGDGSYALSVPPGANRNARVSIRMPGTASAICKGIQLRTRAGARLSAARSVRPGGLVRFSGRLLAPPLKGAKLVELQAHVGDRWMTFAQPRAYKPEGRFHARYRLQREVRSRELVFRARVRREVNYPYLLGVSRSVRVRVRAVATRAQPPDPYLRGCDPGLGTLTARSTPVAFGHAAHISGRATRPDGSPYAGARLIVRTFEYRSRLLERATGPDGRYRVRVPAGSNRNAVVSVPVPGTDASVCVRLKLRTRAGVRLRATRRVAPGGTVRFRGRVLGPRFPRAGKLVELQAFDGGRWRTFAQPRAVAPDGRFRSSYRLHRTSGPRTFRFRARVRVEPIWDYLLGTSPTARVRVG